MIGFDSGGGKRLACYVTLTNEAGDVNPVSLRQRQAPSHVVESLTSAGLDPILARVLAGRGIREPAEVSADLKSLQKPDAMRGLADAAALIADGIAKDQSFCVVGDYDCDGATATALMVTGLRRLGATVDYLVPNRFTDGYGLSAGVVTTALHHPTLGKPNWLITVDNGIASIDGTAAANAQGIGVVITDHHLPGTELPDAAAIVNPNQPGCEFASKHLAGVGVAFYLVAAVRSELRRRQALPEPVPKLSDLLDLVALGTIADLVPLDANNRRLVAAGLLRIQSGKARPGIQALLQAAGLATHRITVRDLGFALGPRINAAGRLEDISIGIECLLARDTVLATELATTLDGINRQRREIEADMREAAIESVSAPTPEQMSLVLYQPDWHEGVVGLVAGRLKDRFHRPTFAFAPGSADPSMLKGSGRSLAGIHLRDALALLDAREPGLMTRFGGHAMAAGLSLPAENIAPFEAGIEKAIAEIALPGALSAESVHDGALTPEVMTLGLVKTLDQQVWGQAFAAPVFCNEFEVMRQRLVGTGHLKLELRLDGKKFSGIFFQRSDPLPDRAWLTYSLQANEFRGVTELQLLVQAHGLPVPDAGV